MKRAEKLQKELKADTTEIDRPPMDKRSSPPRSPAHRTPTPAAPASSTHPPATPLRPNTPRQRIALRLRLVNYRICSPPVRDTATHSPPAPPTWERDNKPARRSRTGSPRFQTTACRIVAPASGRPRTRACRSRSARSPILPRLASPDLFCDVAPGQRIDRGVRRAAPPNATIPDRRTPAGSART